MQGIVSGPEDTRVSETDTALPHMRSRYKTKKYTNNYTMKIVVTPQKNAMRLCIRGT